MRDMELAEEIAAGDSRALGTAYDRYAAALYGYCLTLLGSPADAADAVQDTFVILASRAGQLREPSRLRPWLYAVARNECQRRFRAAARTELLDGDAVVTAPGPGPAASAEQRELRELVSAALAGMSTAEREIIELTLAQDLAGPDLAGALGVPVNHAHSMASRARAHFESALGVLLVARTGRKACPELDSMLAGWGGHLTVLLRKRLGRHITRCAACASRRNRELSPAALLSALPVVVLPAALRAQVLSAAADPVQRAVVGATAGRFGPSGFPVHHGPAHLAHLARYAHAAHHNVARAATAATGAVVLATAGLAGTTLYHHPAPVIPGLSPPGSLEPAAGKPVRPHAGVSPAVRSSRRQSSSRPLPHASGPPPIHPTPAPTQPDPGLSASVGASLPGVPVSVAGSLSVFPPTLHLSSDLAGVVTITAHGGPVSWQALVPSGLLGELTADPASGTLKAGQSAQVEVSAVSSLLNTGASLTVEPGGIAVPVTLPLGL